MAQRTLALILTLVRHDALRALFYTGSLPTHAAHLCLYLLDRLLGERSREITGCRDVAWKPDRIMADIVGLMLALARDPAFVKARPPTLTQSLVAPVQCFSSARRNVFEAGRQSPLLHVIATVSTRSCLTGGTLQTLAMEQSYNEATLRAARAEVDRLETRMPMAAGISYRLGGLIDAAAAARAAGVPAADSLRSSVDAVLALRFDGATTLACALKCTGRSVLCG